MLAEQMIETIEFIHSKGYVHDDLKPDNIWMGIGSDITRLFIGDYGLARKINDKHGTQLPYRQVFLKNFNWSKEKHFKGVHCGVVGGALDL